MRRSLVACSLIPLFSVVAVGVLTGCPDRSIDPIKPTQNGVGLKRIPVSADIDILFVIDNSTSTLDKQTVFSQNFPRFVQALDAFPMGRPNLHIGVINTTIDIKTQGYANGNVGCPSPDPLDNGLLQNTARVAGCMPPNGQFISDIKNDNGSRMVNYSGSLEQALSCIALMGAEGCGFEADLEAMKRALDGSLTANAGFIRNGAYLGIIFLTDEDDASVKDNAVFAPSLDATAGGKSDFRVQPMFAYRCATPISGSTPGTYDRCTPRTDSYLQDPHYYSQFLASVKDPGQIVVAAIAGPPPGLTTNDKSPPPVVPSAISTGTLMLNGITQQMALLPSCSATINGNPAIGRPAIRLASFLSDFGDRGRFYTVCQSDYSAALDDIGKTLFNAISPCLEGPVDPTDADPSNPGTQLQCTVSDVQVDDKAGTTSTLIPACKMKDATTPVAGGARPCWWVDQNPTACPKPDTGFELKLERAAPPPTGTNVVVECSLVPAS